ncbi:catalase-like domain-containing protein [Radiomyces spectabilis]|uniref:catalase-like domain-containing protein n=1 Tax=Radiomyces spectabilis TaxID=64574 RepID=UPI00221E4C4B|nr:catalase-like domain-containing protein [Radiomyces spectabilis]KAI8367505.1 catalase-like domain-containing protein [Radiomyces spectabilis]
MKSNFVQFVSLFLAAQSVFVAQAQCPFHAKRGNTHESNQFSGYVVSDAGMQETTQFGVKINNTDSLKAGLRGPTLLQDFMLREKIMHFDHERIPERAVHARGVGAHGYFETYDDWSHLTAAKFLRTPKKQTPVFVRFSTVLGSRGSADTVRDVRGFATRFYTEEGLFDLVGNIIAPFFVQDAIKFPDLIHAGKPEPDTEVPQAGTAHETAYDFFAELPETIHTVLWALSGRGLPRSLRQVEGFGVHTFRLINEDGKSVFVKFMWKPKQGLSNLVWDEAQKIAGKDSDFHRNDLYTAINRGDYPEWELGVQIVPEKDEDKYDFDLLDPTKIIPESLVPFKPLGKMVLNRNVDNYFAETEQVTFHPGHLVRGIGFTNDPLLQGRLFSYLDTQLNRMGSANYMQLPINRPLNKVHNNQRDGFMQTNIHKGKVAYYPNGLQDNTPSVVDGDKGGYIDYPEEMGGRAMRGKSSKFFDHFSQAQLYWNSLTDAERQQLVDGARFEIGKSKSLDVRRRMIHVLNHVDNDLARRVASAVGVEPPKQVVENKNHTTSGISIERYPKAKHIRTRTVAILTAPGTDKEDAQKMYEYLDKEGAYVEYVGLNLGSQDGLNITSTYVTSSSVLFDAVYVPGGQVAIDTLLDNTSAFPYEEPVMFVLDAYRHGKPIAASNEGVKLLTAARIKLARKLGEHNGVIVESDHSSLQEEFKKALIQQRFWSRFPLDTRT